MTVGAIAGHSMGAIGAILAGAADPRVAAVVATSGPADPYRLTRQTFRLAHLPIPDLDRLPAGLADDPRLRPAARPRRRRHQRGHGDRPVRRARSCSPTASDDTVVPLGHMERLAAAARAARAGDPIAAAVETLVVEGGQHSWLYEDAGLPADRRRRSSTRALGGPLDPADGGRPRRGDRRRRASPTARRQFAAVEATPGGLRTLAQVALPGRDPAAAPGTATTAAIPAAPREPGDR